jgi:DNA-binding transcriptional regulator YiaG
MAAKKKSSAKKYELAYLDYKAGMKYKEIAEKYNVSINTVQTWQRRHFSKIDEESEHELNIDIDHVQEIHEHVEHEEDEHVHEVEVVSRSKVGRPTKYRDDYASQARKLCMLRRAITDEELAEYFEVDVATVTKWKKDHPEFYASIKFGKRHCDESVVESLFSLTQRRTKKVEKVLAVKGEVVKTEYNEELEPSEKACLAWLGVRQKEWRRGIDLDEDSSLHIIVQPGALANGWSPTDKPIDVTPEPNDSDNDGEVED